VVAVSEMTAAGIVAESGHVEGFFVDQILGFDAVSLCHAEKDAAFQQVMGDGERWDGMGLEDVDGRGCRHGKWDDFG